MTFRVESFNSLQSLSPYVKQWNDLTSESPQCLPMLSYAWVASFIEHRLVKGESWRCLMAFDGERLVGVLPYIRTPHRLFGKWATILRAPTDDHTVSGDVLLAVENSTEILQCLLRTLRKRERQQIGLKFQRVHETSPLAAVPRRSLVNTLVAPRPAGRGSYLDTRGELGDYIGSISKNFRANLRKANNKLSRLKGVSYEIKTGGRANDDSLAEFTALEMSGWKGEQGTAIACDQSLLDFYKTLTTRLAECGWLEWHFLYAEDELLAAHLAVRINKAVVIPKIAHNESYATCSPGSLLFKRLVETAFDSNEIDEINCLTNYSWHRKWKMKLAKYYAIWFFPYRPLSVLLGVFPNKLRTLATRAASTRLF